MTRIFLIGIAGASGSGKTHFSNQVLKECNSGSEIGPVALLSEDDYYKHYTTLELDQRSRLNYDHPDAFEHSLLHEQLLQLLDGEDINAPRYDYTTHNRHSHTRVVSGSARVVLVEGILLFHHANIRNLSTSHVLC
eukprot:Filipodium_phascolosomae@DN2680_c0_g1_i1.p1